MKHAEFVHLHVHTQYSLLDGAIRLDDLMNKAKEYHMPAITMTDHGNMFGTIDFYEKANKNGLKPIIGCEMYLAPGSRFDKDASSSKGSNNHLILLATNKTGYHNLLKLVSAAYIEGMYYKPRIDKQILREHHDGLIALSACLHGEIPHAILAGDMKQALALADEYRQLFDNERFYLEMQENKLDDQRRVNEGLLEIAKKTGIPLVATNDCHYLNAGDAFAHEVLLCIQTGKTMETPNRMRFSTQEFYFKSPGEIKKRIYDLAAWINQLQTISPQKGAVVLKYYNALPLDFYLHQQDWLFVGPYLKSRGSQQTITYEFGKGGRGYAYFTDYFKELWEDEMFAVEVL